MKNFKVTVNGKSYDVSVEEVTEDTPTTTTEETAVPPEEPTFASIEEETAQ